MCPIFWGCVGRLKLTKMSQIVMSQLVKVVSLIRPMSQNTQFFFDGFPKTHFNLLLIGDNISVCVFWFDKEIFIEKSHNTTSKIPILLQVLD